MAGTPYKRLSRGVTSGSYYEKLVIVFRMTAHVVFEKSLYTSSARHVGSHAINLMKTLLQLSEKMNMPKEALPNCKHAVALLRGLNLQREFGHFCDCVIKLAINPGRLFLAHKSVLAASSPVLAALLATHGALLNLQFPCLCPETMDYLLEYIYTGKLPPKSQEESVLSVAVDLQMVELQHALALERSVLLDSANVQNQTDMKGTVPPAQHEEGEGISPTYPSRFKRTSPSSLLSEAVPVIQHASAYGKSSPVQQTRKPYCSFHMAGKRRASADNREVTDDAQRKDFANFEIPTQELKHGSPVRTDDEQIGPSTKKAKVSPSKTAADSVPQHHCQSPAEIADGLLDSGSRAVVETSVTVSPQTVCVLTQIKQPRHNDNTSSPSALREASEASDAHSATDFPDVFDHGKGAADRFKRTGYDLDPPHPFAQPSGASSSSSCCLDTEHYEHVRGDVSRHLPSDTETQYAVHVAVRRQVYPQPSSGDTCEMSADSKPWFRSVGVTPLNSVKAVHGITADIAHGAENVAGGNSHSNSSSTPERSCSDHEDPSQGCSPRSSVPSMYHGQVSYQCLSQPPPHVSVSSDSEMEGLESNSTQTPDLPLTPTPGGAVPTAPSNMSSMGRSGATRSSSPSFRTRQQQHLHQQQQLQLQLQQQPYQCSMCERAFSQRGSLNRHMRSHLGVRPYSCPQCPMTFSRQYRVTEHMRVHQRGCEDLQKAGPT